MDNLLLEDTFKAEWLALVEWAERGTAPLHTPGPEHPGPAPPCPSPQWTTFPSLQQ